MTLARKLLMGANSSAAFSCTMTAGTLGHLYGYYAGVFGSISNEPVPGAELAAIMTNGSAGQIFFYGDWVSTLAGLSVWVDGVEYPFDDHDWTYTSATEAGWSSAGPTFVDGLSYLIEFK